MNRLETLDAIADAIRQNEPIDRLPADGLKLYEAANIRDLENRIWQAKSRATKYITEMLRDDAARR